MLITYLIVTLIVGLFMSFIWSSNGGANVLIKMLFTVWTIWTGFMLLTQLGTFTFTNGMRLL